MRVLLLASLPETSKGLYGIYFWTFFLTDPTPKIITFDPQKKKNSSLLRSVAINWDFTWLFWSQKYKNHVRFFFQDFGYVSAAGTRWGGPWWFTFPGWTPWGARCSGTPFPPPGVGSLQVLAHLCTRHLPPKPQTHSLSWSAGKKPLPDGSPCGLNTADSNNWEIRLD